MQLQSYRENMGAYDDEHNLKFPFLHSRARKTSPTDHRTPLHLRCSSDRLSLFPNTDFLTFYHLPVWRCVFLCLCEHPAMNVRLHTTFKLSVPIFNSHRCVTPDTRARNAGSIAERRSGAPGKPGGKTHGAKSNQTQKPLPCSSLQPVAGWKLGGETVLVVSPCTQCLRELKRYNVYLYAWNNDDGRTSPVPKLPKPLCRVLCFF